LTSAFDRAGCAARARRNRRFLVAAERADPAAVLEAARRIDAQRGAPFAADVLDVERETGQRNGQDVPRTRSRGMRRASVSTAPIK
jgi:hypothetical protein